MTPELARIGSLFEDDEGAFDFLPAPSLIHFHNSYMLPVSREIHITESINEETGMWFVRCVRWLETRDRARGESSTTPIRVVICTPGGDEEAMFTIHDAIRTTRCPVEVIGTGIVCSAGVILLACGDCRLVTENLALMSHESHGSEEGLGFRASKDRMKYREWQHVRWCELMARYTPDEQTTKWWLNTTKNRAEYWLMGGKEIVDAGLADELIYEWPVGVPTDIVKRDFEGVR